MSRKSRNDQAAAAAAAVANQAANTNVEPAVQQDPPGPGIAAVYRNDDRDNALNEILADRAGKAAAELPKFEADPNVTEDQPRAPDGKFAKKDDAPAPQVEPQAQEPAPVVEKVKLVVDGENVELDPAEVEAMGGVAAAQKSLAADKRLKEAKEAIAESKRMQAQMAQVFQYMTQQRQPAAPPPPTMDELIAANISKIQLGTPEEGVAALKQILTAATPQVNPQQLLAQATNQSLIRFRQEQAAEAFKQEFGDILANPMVYRLAVIEESDRLAKGMPQDFNAFYRGLGNELRAAFGGQNQPAPAAQTEGNTSPKSEKEARKATIVNLPTAGSRAAAQEEPKPKTREEVLNEARKARGLPIG